MANTILNTPGGNGQVPAGKVIIGNGYTGNLATFNGKIFVMDLENLPEEPDPLNPLNLPPNTIRVRFISGYTPDMGTTRTLVDANENIWDITTSYNGWEGLFYEQLDSNEHYLIEILGANSKNITNMSFMCYACNNLINVPLINTSSVTDVSHMFQYCRNVQHGQLNLYNQLAPQFPEDPYENYHYCFYQCGSNTETGRAELEQIPIFWS